MTTVLRMILADLSEVFLTVDAPCIFFIVSCPVSVEKQEKGSSLSTFLFLSLRRSAFSSSTPAICNNTLCQ